MFNKNLKNIRLQQELSQKQVADYLSISPQSVSKWEKGEALPSIDYLPKLAELLNCDINAFFVPISERTIDNSVLNDFLSLENEVICSETKTLDDIVAFIRECPAIVEEATAFLEELMEHKTVQPKTIQAMLDCSDAEARVFIEHLEQGEMLEKLDFDNAYFVIKDAVNGLIILIKVQQIFCEKTDDNRDLMTSLKQKL